MLLTYNGIQLQIEQFTGFEQNAIYSADGKDFLYTHVRVACRAIWNRQATGTAETPAATSIDDLRGTLMVPRKTLIISVPSGGSGASRRILASPLLRLGEAADGERYNCDANNGPTPLSLNVLQVIGEESAIVEYVIETWVNECATMRAILSHRWTMENMIDEHYYTTRTISGTAIFRTDFLTSSFDPNNPVGSPGLFADSFRHLLFHPVPNNFKRERVQVRASADGTRLDYSIIDVEQPANLVDTYRGVITKIKAGYSEFTGRQGMNVTDALVDSANGGGIMSLIGGLAKTATLPSVKKVLKVQVWGGRHTTRRTLIGALSRAMINFNFNGGQFLGVTLVRAWFNTTFFHVDLVDKYAEMHIEADLSGSYALILQEAGLMPGLPAILDQVGAIPEEMPGITQVANTPGQTTSDGTGTRGFYIEQMATKTLKAICEEVTTPGSS